MSGPVNVNPTDHPLGYQATMSPPDGSSTLTLDDPQAAKTFGPPVSAAPPSATKLRAYSSAFRAESRHNRRGWHLISALKISSHGSTEIDVRCSGTSSHVNNSGHNNAVVQRSAAKADKVG